MLTIALQKDLLTVRWLGEVVALSEKWVMFYALLALHIDRYISIDELCDYHPWSRLRPEVAGRDVWRFTQNQERRYFGQRLTHSPARQASKLFSLVLDDLPALRFEPDRPSVADHLRSLRAHRNEVALELGECALLLQGGLIEEALGRLAQLRLQKLHVNERAQLEVLTTMCLDELRGVHATAGQLPVLSDLLTTSGLNRLSRARILIRLARHHTLSGEYPAASTHFRALRDLLTPEDGVDFCWFHLNYGLYLRRTGQLEQALHHQRLAHDVAQVAEWWVGVYSARLNLALVYLSLADQSPTRARQRLLEQALDWALRANTTGILTHRVIAMAVSALLVGRIYRLLTRWPEARHWLEQAKVFPQHVDQSAHLAVVWDELALVEEAVGNHFFAQLHRQTAAQLREESRQP